MLLRIVTGESAFDRTMLSDMMSENQAAQLNALDAIKEAEWDAGKEEEFFGGKEEKTVFTKNIMSVP